MNVVISRFRDDQYVCSTENSNEICSNSRITTMKEFNREIERELNSSEFKEKKDSIGNLVFLN